MNKLNIFGIFSEYSSRRSSWPCELWIKMLENVNFSLWGKWRNLSYIIISCTIFFHFLVYCDRDEATGSVIGHWNCIRKKIELGIFNWLFSLKFFFSSFRGLWSNYFAKKKMYPNFSAIRHNISKSAVALIQQKNGQKKELLIMWIQY